MQIEPWHLLYGGSLVHMDKDNATLKLHVSLPRVTSHLSPPAKSLVVELAGVGQAFFLKHEARWDDPEVREPAEIVAAGVDIRSPRRALRGEIILDGQKGFVLLDYEQLSLSYEGRQLSLDELRRAAELGWAQWLQSHGTRELHPLVVGLMQGAPLERGPLEPALEAMLLAWRDARTSDLAEAIEILDQAVRQPPPIKIESIADLDSWRVAFHRAPVPSLHELARCANWTFDIDDPDIDVAHAKRKEWWDEIRKCVEVVREDADPRIARALLRMLWSPSDYWFRVDQVAHVVGSFPKSDDTPSFADHLLALVQKHGDAATPGQLQLHIKAIGQEADCNGAEMVERLQALAAQLSQRWPRHNPLTPDEVGYLRHRTTTVVS